MIKPKIKYDFRAKYAEELFSWKGKDLSAQHRLYDLGDGKVTFSALGNPVMQSDDEGKTWHISSISLPPFTSLFRRGNHWICIKSGTDLRRSLDGGITWGPIEHIPTPDEVQFAGLGRPNVFCVVETARRGNIILATDNWLGQEGPDGQILGATVSEDFGRSWKLSRLFGPPEPLPPSPQGFGEPSIVSMPSGWLWMVFRTTYGELWQCISRDEGLTWGRLSPTGLSSPNANCYAKRAPDGSTVIAFNLTRPGMEPSFGTRESLYGPRRNLVFMISRDNCRTWTEPVVIDPGYAQYATIHFTEKSMMLMYQKSPDEKTRWGDMGLMLAVYDWEEIKKIPPLTLETLKPYVEKGLLAHWLNIAIRRKSG